MWAGEDALPCGVLEKHLLFWARFWVPEQALQKNSISSTGANRRGIFFFAILFNPGK